MNWTTCPSLAELFSADDDLSDELREHIATCRRCQALRRHLQPAEIEAATEPLAKDPLRRDLDQKPARGSIYAIHGPLSDEYLVGALVDWDEKEAVVVPLSDEVRFATNWDLLLDEQLLGYRAMAEVWNHGTVLVEQLNEKLGELGEWASALEALYAAALEGSELPTALPVGPAVLSEVDPRNAFHDQEGERIAVYWQPANLLASVVNVFELVRLRREELELEPEALGAVDANALEQLEVGKVDITNEVPAAVLANLLRQLQLSAGRRLEQLIAAAALASYREPLETRTMLARKRKGMRKPPQAVDRERFVAEYARKVIEEMKD
jgi:hypothetical protein